MTEAQKLVKKLKSLKRKNNPKNVREICNCQGEASAIKSQHKQSARDRQAGMQAERQTCTQKDIKAGMHACKQAGELITLPAVKHLYKQSGMQPGTNGSKGKQGRTLILDQSSRDTGIKHQQAAGNQEVKQ